MKKSIVVAVAMAMVIGMGSAYAGTYDITHPLFTPDRGQFLSETNFTYSRYKYKTEKSFNRDKQYNRSFTETVTYGISDKWNASVFGRKDFEKTTSKYGTQYKRRIDDWGLMAKYKILDGEKTYWDVQAKYYQEHYERLDSLDKIFSLSSTYGKNYKIGTLYFKCEYGNTLNQGKENDGVWIATLGWNKKLCDKLALGVDADYSQYSDETKDKQSSLGIDLTYKFTNNTSLQVFGRYMLSDNTDKDWGAEYKSGCKYGVNFRIAF